MTDSFLRELVKSEVYGKGNFFTAGRGIVILKDIKIFKSSKSDSGGDPYTEVAEFLVKESHKTAPDVEPNAVGSLASVIFKLTAGKSPKSQRSSAQKLHFAILGAGAEALPEDKLVAAMSALLRPFPDDNPLKGRTDPAKPCPAKGLQVAYDTYKSTGDGRYYPNFYAIDTSPAQLQENLALLAGK